MLKLTKIFLLLLVSANFAQSPLLTLMNDEGLTPYPKTDDLVASYDENEMTVSNWSDQTGTANLLQAVSANQPALITNALNGYPALRFDGDLMVTSTFSTLNQPITIYFVMKINTWTDGQSIFQDGNTGLLLANGGGSNNVYIYAGTDYSPIRSYSAGTYRISAIVLNGASSLWQVNDNVASGNPGTAGIVNFTIAPSARVDFVCIYVHSTAHDLATRTEIIGWLNEKYGVY